MRSRRPKKCCGGISSESGPTPKRSSANSAKSRSPLRFTFTTSRRFSADPGSIWKIYTSNRRRVVWGSAERSCDASRESRSGAIVDAWNGRCWIGTSRHRILQVLGCNPDDRLDDSPSDRGCSPIVGTVAVVRRYRIGFDQPAHSFRCFCSSSLAALRTPRRPLRLRRSRMPLTVTGSKWVDGDAFVSFPSSRLGTQMLEAPLLTARSA